jgi:hypothetical protein
LSTDEERDYGKGERIFGLQGDLKNAKFRVSVPHRTSTTIADPIFGAETRPTVSEDVRRSPNAPSGDSGSNEGEISRLVTLLSDPDRAQDPSAFLTDHDAADHAGLYSWWADSAAQKLFACVFARQGIDLVYRHTEGEWTLVYVGQAGATRWPSGKVSDATLMSRVGSLHINGNVAGSTFRKTISAILLDSLDLRVVGPDRLAANGESKVSKFISEHLRVRVVPLGDRDSLKRTEQAVLEELDPPFNIEGRPETPVRRQLSNRRGRFKVS